MTNIYKLGDGASHGRELEGLSDSLEFLAT